MSSISTRQTNGLTSSYSFPVSVRTLYVETNDRGARTRGLPDRPSSPNHHETVRGLSLETSTGKTPLTETLVSCCMTTGSRVSRVTPGSPSLSRVTPIPDSYPKPQSDGPGSRTRTVNTRHTGTSFHQLKKHGVKGVDTLPLLLWMAFRLIYNLLNYTICS